MKLTLIGLAMAIGLTSCEKELIVYRQGDMKICVEQGQEWLHDFPMLLGIKKKNPPQIAIWLEDMQGNYLSTVYVSHKIATQDWLMAKGNRRKEALPHWCHSRGIRYDDGLYLPTKEEPIMDGISGATPHESFDVKLKTASDLKQFIINIEVNHSTDFNDCYQKNAQEGDAHYSGGKEGSGQPAIIYRANIDLSKEATSFEATLIGHSSPDGSDGEIHTDMSGLTIALDIIKQITINIQ